MISRLIFQYKDDSISVKDCFKKTLLEIICSLVFIFGLKLGFLWLAVIIIGLNGLTYYLDNRNKGNIFIYRFLVLILYCCAFGLFFPAKVNYITNNPVIQIVKGFFEEHNLLFFMIKKISWKYFLVFLSGALLVANEVNHIVRVVLSRLKVEPQMKKEDSAKATPQTNNMQEKNRDTIELKRGRIIGIIERILMYYFVIEGNLTSIGFILAAKSFTRFKELDDKDFAEYVLIGTLLSAFLAIATGILVKKALL
jgi:hypothetical protein